MGRLTPCLRSRRANGLRGDAVQPWEEVWSFFAGGGLVGADVLSGGHCTYLLEEGFGSVDVPETPYLPDCWTLDGPRAFNCTLSPDGSKLACVERTRPDAEDVVTVRNTATGEMLLESSGTADALDLDDRHLLVTVDGGSKIVSLEQASHEIDVPLGGLAHLVGDVPVEVAGVVPAPTEPTHPEVIVFGSWGATRLSNQGAIRLLTEPVSHAESDLMGGIVFQYDAENDDSEQPVWWLHESGELMQIGSAFEGVFSVGAIRGRPTLIHGIDRPLYWSDYEVGFGATMFTDLHSGHRRLFMRDTLTEWGLAEISGAGDRIAGVTWGGGSWDVGALLFDPWGAPIEAPASVPSRCYPCIVQPRLSPDGSRLAFVRWTLGHDATTEPGAAPAALLVVDLASGAVLYDEELAPFCAPEWGYGGGGPPCHAMVRLVDFDGRHVVTWHRAGSQWFSRIADTAGELSAVTVPGTAMLMKQSDVSESISEMDAFWTSVLGSIPAVEPEHRGEATGLDQALEQANRLANDLGIEVHVLLSNDYSTLRPGYWMVYAGVFSDRESATVTCEDLGPFVDSCYPRHVATPRSLDRE